MKYCLTVHSRDGKWLKILRGDYLTDLKKWSTTEKIFFDMFTDNDY